MTSKLDELRRLTTVVADTGDIEEIQKYKPEDATTNPSLILKAAQIPEYQAYIQQAIAYGKQQNDDPAQQLVDASDMLAVTIGLEVLKVVPGTHFNRSGCPLIL